MTKKLYYEDMAKTEFAARVIEKNKRGKGWEVILDQTCFYPEGGGQPADHGEIEGIKVFDVQKKGGLVIHYLEKEPGAVEVKCRVDKTRRIDYQQQHTGQHILSGALWQVGGYKTLSVHMGADYTTIEIDSARLPQQDLEKAEHLANLIICRNLKISVVNTNDNELSSYPDLRKPTDLKGEIRLVKIGDFDLVACGGVHVSSTGGVGLIKAIGVEKIRGNIRVAFKIGARAYSDYQLKDKVISGLKAMLGTGENEVLAKVESVNNDLVQARKEVNYYRSRLAAVLADRILVREDVRTGGPAVIITEAFEDEDPEIIKKIIKNLIEHHNVLVCLVNVLKNDLHWSISCAEDVKFELAEFKDELLTIIDGKGGGRFPLWQGIGSGKKKLPDFFSRFREIAADVL